MVPDGWEVHRFSDVCSLINGRGFKPHEWDTEGYPIIRIQNLNGSDDFNFFSGEFNPKILVKNGELLFAWSGSRGTSFGPHIWNGSDAVLNYHTWRVVPKDLTNKGFLFQYLRHITTEIESTAHGASALVHTQKDTMERRRCVLPPLAEQKKIAEILSTCDRAIEVAEAQLVCARTQKRALMQQLLTGRRRFPEFEGQEWREVRLGDVAKVERGKFSARPRNDPKFYGGSFPFVQTGDVSASSLFLDSHNQTLNEEGVKVSRMFPEGTILMTIAANIGDVAITSYPVYCPDSVVGISATSGLADTIWLFHVLQMEKEGLDRSAPKLAQKNINLERLRPLPISLPNLAEQKAIGEVLLCSEKEIGGHAATVTKLRVEKKALMQQLLTGKRRVSV